MRMKEGLSLQPYARNRWLVLDTGVPVATINFIPVQDAYGFRSDIIGADLDFTCYSSTDNEEDRAVARDRLLEEFSAHYPNQSTMSWTSHRTRQGSGGNSWKIWSYG